MKKFFESYLPVKDPSMSGTINIVNENNEVINVLENNLDQAINHENVKPGTYVIVNNLNSQILISGKYIEEWNLKRQEAILKNATKHVLSNKTKVKKKKS